MINPNRRKPKFRFLLTLQKHSKPCWALAAALTDASAETFYKLPKDKQQELLIAYFDKEKGIGYTLARTHIQSCDFLQSETYSYVKDNDRRVKNI